MPATANLSLEEEKKSLGDSLSRMFLTSLDRAIDCKEQKVRLVEARERYPTTQEKKDAPVKEPRYVAELIKKDNGFCRIRDEEGNKYSTFVFDVDIKDGKHIDYLTIKNRLVEHMKKEYDFIQRLPPSWSAHEEPEFEGSYRICFPEFYTEVSSLQRFVEDFKARNPDLSPFIDVSIYKNGLLRYPNQTIPDTTKDKHKQSHISPFRIQSGTELDFVNDFIPENAIYKSLLKPTKQEEIEPEPEQKRNIIEDEDDIESTAEIELLPPDEDDEAEDIESDEEKTVEVVLTEEVKEPEEIEVPIEEEKEVPETKVELSKEEAKALKRKQAEELKQKKAEDKEAKRKKSEEAKALKRKQAE
jgi:hypothetical protein